MADGLKDNQILLGLHISEGNSGSVDPMGFLHSQRKLEIDYNRQMAKYTRLPLIKQP
jgi:hypothetical protein